MCSLKGVLDFYMSKAVPLQVPYDRREELLIKGGLDPKKDLLNLTLRYNVSTSESTASYPCHALTFSRFGEIGRETSLNVPKACPSQGD